MAPRRKTRRSQYSSRSRPRKVALLEEYQTMSIMPPATSISVGVIALPAEIIASTFRLIKFTVTAASMDVATANKFNDGPAFFQLRQLAVDGISTLRSSPVFAAGPQPRTFQLQTDKLEYPGPWKGASLIAVDCLCPKSGYERGIGITVKLRFSRDHVPVAEACPTVEAYPTNFTIV